jgi:dTDP-glucose 4,6-dehydratase
MQTILVTGGAGFIGSCLVRRIVAGRQFRVINLDKLTYAGNLDSLESVLDDPRHIFVQGDIGNRPQVSALLKEYQPVAIINLAAESHVDRSIDSPAAFVETNVGGTFRLLEAALEYWSQLPEDARRDFRFLHVSTDEVYGSLGPEGRFTESTPYAPNSPYSASKAAGDHFVRAYFHTYGLPTLTTNCSNNYGPCQFPEKLIPLMILNALAGRPLPVYGDGQNIRDWLFVEDHCDALLAALARGRPGQVYNLGGNCERTNLEVVQAICDTVDRLRPLDGGVSRRQHISFVTDRPGHDRRYAIDASKAHRELDWQPTVSFEEGLERTVRWYLENSRWVERVTSGGYRGQRLGLAQRPPRTELESTS